MSFLTELPTPAFSSMPHFLKSKLPPFDGISGLCLLAVPYLTCHTWLATGEKTSFKDSVGILVKPIVLRHILDQLRAGCQWHISLAPESPVGKA
ncbi:hypothetical protein N431DRAFT_428542 [Stipitochalara longipes BDJ]|nr:hypothetical protein N431DRAFT_428542 [Stipitochalara longipes BDJ]